MVVVLHYIGNRFYDRERFEREAKVYGVARAMPLKVIKKLRFGQRIFVAFYKKDKHGKPYAEVFGYFVINGINYTSASPELRKKIAEDERIKIKEISQPSDGEVVVRGCGSYSIGSIAVLNDDVTLETLATVIEEKAKELGEKVRVMVTGIYYPLPEPKKLYGVKFTRSVLKLQIDEKELLTTPVDVEPTEKRAVQVEDYNLRKYLSKKEKEALMTKTLDAWLF
ncbi:protein of unknown function (plasmid) [Thermococcus nautili]|nr:protein of unknown function [Thermococcus nautili]